MAKVKIELSNNCEEFEWESKLDELHYHMVGFEGFTGHWRVEGSNLGWRIEQVGKSLKPKQQRSYSTKSCQYRLDYSN